MSQPALRNEVSKYQLLKERLLENCSTIDEETLGDTLEGITDLHEMIAVVIRSALVDEALQAGLRSRLEEMRQLHQKAAIGARRYVRKSILWLLRNNCGPNSFNSGNKFARRVRPVERGSRGATSVASKKGLAVAR